MHGSEAAALMPALALLSTPSPLTLAIIGAITVVVHEARRLARRLGVPQRPSPATTTLLCPTAPGDASAGVRPVRSLAVPPVAPGESGQLASAAALRAPGAVLTPAPSITPRASPIAVAPPPAPPPNGARSATPQRRASDRRLALACLVAAGLATAWAVRGSSGRPSSKAV